MINHLRKEILQRFLIIGFVASIVFFFFMGKAANAALPGITLHGQGTYACGIASSCQSQGTSSHGNYTETFSVSGKTVSGTITTSSQVYTIVCTLNNSNTSCVGTYSGNGILSGSLIQNFAPGVGNNQSGSTNFSLTEFYI